MGTERGIDGPDGREEFLLHPPAPLYVVQREAGDGEGVLVCGQDPDELIEENGETVEAWEYGPVRRVRITNRSAVEPVDG